MALFKSPAEKTAKKEERIQRMLSKYGLEEIQNPKDIDSIRKIAQELFGTGMQETGMALSMGAKAHEALPVYYQRAILEQNWIIIRQLDRICNLLETK